MNCTLFQYPKDFHLENHFVCYFLVWFGLETTSCFVAQADLDLTGVMAQAGFRFTVSSLASAFQLLELHS